LGESLLAQGIGAENLTQVIAALNDRLTQRILDVTAPRYDLSGITMAWIALGSEGRYEQTFSTDQDNALIFAADALDADAVRGRLLPFAQAVNRLLDACGFPLCKGNIMAGNPDLCLSKEEWQMRFAQWIDNPTPDALLKASIFFDLRALWGEASLVDGLRQGLLRQVREARLFLRMLASNALATRAPLGFFGGLVTAAGDGGERTIDLKGQGTRLFIDAARVQALAYGIASTNTAARMRAAGPQLGVKPEETDAAIDSFHFLLLLRLRHQGGPEGRVAGEPNRIDPHALNELDRRILKEAMRHAATVQERLRLDYQL
jgi:CBS domain-containing protein